MDKVKQMNQYWQSDRTLFDMMKTELFSAVLGDIMDQLGLNHQFLPPTIKPLRRDMVVAGRAMPVLLSDSDREVAARFTSKPFGLMLEALDDLKPNEVYLAAGASPTYALWGELMSSRAIRLKAAGAVMDGFSRDTQGILTLGFPTFSYGSYAQDQMPRGKVIDFRVPVSIQQVAVQPGDIVFGDLDGVCIIPRNLEREIIEKAWKKAKGEKQVKTAIEKGMSACQAFDKYGIM